MRNFAALRFGLSLGLVAITGGSALAQLTGGDTTTTTTTTTTDSEIPPYQPPQQTMAPQETTTVSTTTTTVDAGGDNAKNNDTAVDGRPGPLSFGIGFGWAFPTDIQVPNASSVRVRLPSGLTFEPQVTLGIDRESPDDDTTNSVTTLELGTLVRVPVMSNSKFDFEALVGAAVGTVLNDPDGDDNNSSVTNFGINWGIAVGYWITAHWNLSMSAYTPFFNYTKQSDDNGDGPSNINVGIIWDPTVVAMIHLYH